jgi:hypothetical protein
MMQLKQPSASNLINGRYEIISQFIPTKLVFLTKDVNTNLQIVCKVFQLYEKQQFKEEAYIHYNLIIHFSINKAIEADYVYTDDKAFEFDGKVYS